MTTKTKAMSGLERSTLIGAPIEKVFAYYSNPEKLPEVWPSLVEVSNVAYTPEGWPQSFDWVYKMAGMRFTGRTENSVFEPNRRYVAESRGGLESTIEATFEDQGGKTLLTERVQYRVPIPLLGRMAERALEKMNENELATIHANLKVIMESE